LVIYISPGSVAIQLRCARIFNNHVIALQNVSIKEFLKSVNFWQRYGQTFSGTFLWLTVYGTAWLLTNCVGRLLCESVRKKQLFNSIKLVFNNRVMHAYISVNRRTE